MDENQFIERHILLGLITSTEYLKEIRDVWDDRFLMAPTAKRVARWCIEYYDKYRKAPDSDIESIYFEKLRKGNILQDEAEELEEEILPDLSDEYERGDKFNVEYLLDQTRTYFNERNLEMHQEDIQTLIDRGEIEEAEKLANAYRPLKKALESFINFSDRESLKRVKKAFKQQSKPLIEYPGALGEFLNHHLVREGFIAFLAPEKRGKSYQMLDLARRAVKQRLKVAFFQAGDMSESQQIRRLAIHLAKKSDMERYVGTQYEPVKDCIKNQSDECDLKIRERHIGLMGDHAPITPEQAREGLTLDELKELKKGNPEYRPCYNCKKFQHKPWGCSWIDKVDVGAPLRGNEAVSLFEEYFVENKRSFMLSTHPNNTLSVGKIKGTLDKWYKEGFVPDVIVVDYAELLTDDTKEYRHKQDAIWKDLRSLSEERHALVVTATQADANAYEQGLLRLQNFSEDKRKFSHVTAMFGLNQDPEGIEKDIGIMRINCLVARESEQNPQQVVHVLQNLKRGQPVLTSYW